MKPKLPQNEFALLLKLSGLLRPEAVTFLGASISSIEKAVLGLRSAPPTAIEALSDLINRQTEAAAKIVEEIDEEMPEHWPLAVPATDEAANDSGMPTVSAWRMVAARVIAASPVPVTLTPDGSNFGLLVRLSGLSRPEAAAVLGGSVSALQKMCYGSRTAPPDRIELLCDLINVQTETAAKALPMIAKAMIADAGAPEITIGQPVDDEEARGLGFATVSLWEMMVARVIAASPVPIKLVPRGTTPETAAAADMREKAEKTRKR